MIDELGLLVALLVGSSVAAVLAAVAGDALLERLSRRRSSRAGGSSLILPALRPESGHLAPDPQFSDVVGVVIGDDQATPEEGVLAGTVGHRREEVTGRITDELDDGFEIPAEPGQRLPPLS